MAALTMVFAGKGLAAIVAAAAELALVDGRHCNGRRALLHAWKGLLIVAAGAGLRMVTAAEGYRTGTVASIGNGLALIDG